MISARRRRSHGAGRPVIVVAFIAVLLSLLGPGLSAGAQIENAGTPVSEETAVPDFGEDELDAQAAEPGDLVIQLKTCPAGFDLSTGWLGDCGVLTDGTGFTLSGEGVTQAGTTGDDGSGRTRFEALAAGTYQVTQAIPGGVASTFVWGCFVLDGASVAPIEPLSYGNILTYTMDPGESYLCDWYNIPAGDGESGDSTFEIAVFAMGCPGGIAPGAAFHELTSSCSTPLTGTAFKVTDAATTHFATIGPGARADFGGVIPRPDGTVTLTEAIPSGYRDPVVYCSDGRVTPTFEPVAVSGGSVVVDSAKARDGGVTCYFFHDPDDDGTGETGTVHVSKYTCPAGVERSDDDYLLSEQCREVIDPVSFEVSDAAGADISLTLNPGVPQTGDASGLAFGTIWIAEILPEGYGEPRVFCSDTPADGAGNYEPVPVRGGSAAEVELRAEAGMPLTCLFFNFPEGDDDPGNTVTVNKYVCPSWVNAETDVLLDACAPGGDGIPFTFVDGNGRHPAAVSGGSITWADAVIGAEGELQIIEDIPTGYADPWVVCDGILMASANGFVIPNPGAARPFHVECDWFNLALEDAALAVVKHTCAPGYDLHAGGADPMADCPEPTDGVDFRVAGMGADMTSTTGDAGAGMVQFGGLDPGTYTLTEAVPAGVATSFVLDCYGNDIGAVRPYPLATGGTLDLTLSAGEAVTCHWFNVPESEGGELTITKLLCAGEAFTSEVECEVYEDGATFDLAIRQDGAWVTIATGTTDDHGRIAWTGLEPGRYWLAEHGGEWCHIASEQLDDDLTGFIVEDGGSAAVKIYNCGAEPGKPGKTPTMYPDTGVPPAGAGAGGGVTSAAAALAGLLALPLNRRRLAALATALPAAGMMGRTLARDDGQTIEPIDGTAGPASLCLPSSGDACERGPVPASLRIDAIGVDAPIEILETVAGEMQQPTGAASVAWYKETARLGETGNMLLAGHLNWWGVPEAVFYNLATLVAGDEIVTADAGGQRWVYAVEWVREVPAGEEPGEEMLGMTSWPAMTLITCGGTWDGEASEYDQRTVVRANLVDSA